MSDPSAPVPPDQRLAKGGRPQGDVAATPTIRSSDLLGQGREIFIEHDGSLYRLRLTRNGKLILHK